jgi:hypothetical protein
MSILDDTRFIETPHFFSGQRLFATDLQDLHAFNREMRWLHNASLHQAGIGNGFAVSGRKGERTVSVGAGYAIDARGREIVLTQPVELPVPPVAGEADGGPVFYDLAIAYPEADQLEEAETRDGVCLPRGAVRLREEPQFCWVRLEADEIGNLHAINDRLKLALESGLAIVLARAEIRNCQLERDISIAERRSARQSTHPYIAAGIAESPDWKTSFDTSEVIVMRASIDTRNGRFSSTPTYWARIDGSHIVTVTQSSGQTTIPLADVVQIVEPGPEGFQVLVAVLGPTEPNAATKKALQAALEDWKVVWLGVES